MTNREHESSTLAFSRTKWRQLFALAQQILYQELVLLIRYPVNTLGRFISLVMLFVIIFFGGRAIGGAAFDDSLSGIIVGYFLFTMVTAAYTGLAKDVMREAQWGTLEQLFMSPHGVGTVFTIKTIVNILLSFLWGFVLLATMLIITNQLLIIDALTIIPIITITLLSVIGIGFIFAGFALVYKRINNVFALVQFVFIGLIAAPTADKKAFSVLPVTQGSEMLYQAMNEGVRFWEFSMLDLSLLVAVGVIYLTIGYAVFLLLLHRARRLGVMGHY